MKNDYHIKTSVLLSVEMSHIAISSIDYKVLLKSGDRLLGGTGNLLNVFSPQQNNGIIFLCNNIHFEVIMRQLRS